jgi:hypothetical protein
MSTPLKQKLLTAAAADANLGALLGPSPFRWYSIQLMQGSAWPAVVVQIISTIPKYTYSGRAQNPVQNRVQFTIWGGPGESGTQAAYSVENALKTFLDGFDAIGVPGLVLYPNYITLERDGFFIQTDTGIYQRLLDVMIWDNQNI